MNKHITLLLAICILGLVTSCVNKATKYLNKGVFEFNMERFEFAIENLKQAQNYGAPSAETNYYLAESYRLSNRMHEAEAHYKKAIDGGIKDDHAHFYYAFALKSNGNYEGAIAQLKKYAQLGTNFDYLNRAKIELANLENLKDIFYQKPFYTATNFKELNTEGIEYSPMMRGDELYFTSSRGIGPMYPGQGTRFTDIFQFKFDGVSKLSGFSVPLNDKINLPRTHEATSTFSPDGKTMIFSRSNTGKKNAETLEVDLYESHLEAGEWTEPKKLDISIRDFWDSNPSLSPDGKTLYFSSNRDGGQGSDDIWKSTKDEDGNWTTPVNLGKEVNTPGAEHFPTVNKEGTLFFASDGHAGFGGLDLFEYHKMADGKYKAKNLGKPINSAYDDFAITYTQDSVGFFCSNRPGGKGDDDIYFFTYHFEIKYYLEGVVTGKKIDSHNHVSEQEQILPNTTVSMMDGNGNLISTTTSDSLGKFRFQVEMEKEYQLKGVHPKYLTSITNFSTVGKSIPANKLRDLDRDVVFQTKIILVPPVKDQLLDFAPIFYPYNKWEITPEASKVLDHVVTTLKNNPDVKIELGSHTDPRNTIRYNDILSQLRAESAVKYLIKNGIEPSRVVAKGYGERVPLVVKRDTTFLKAGIVLTHKYIESLKDTSKMKFAYQLNRRTEFKVVDVVVKPVDPSKIEVVKKNEKDQIVEPVKKRLESQLIKKYLLPSSAEEDKKKRTNPKRI